MPAEIIIDIEGLIYVADWDLDTISQEQKTPLDRLVAEAVATDMLEDEPLVEELLTRFRERLLLSLEFVNKPWLQCSSQSDNNLLIICGHFKRKSAR